MTNGEEKKKQKQKLIFEELRTVEDPINQILCYLEPHLRIKIFDQEMKYHAYIILLLNAYILMCP